MDISSMFQKQDKDMNLQCKVFEVLAQSKIESIPVRLSKQCSHSKHQL